MTTPESYDGPVIPLVLIDGTTARTIEMTWLNTRVIQHVGDASLYDAICIDDAAESASGETSMYLFKRVWNFLLGDYDEREQELLDRSFRVEIYLEESPQIRVAYDKAMAQIAGSLDFFAG